MPRKLKTYQTSIGFFDLAISAPSMKAAAEAWGSDTDVFKKGFAKETDDPEIVAATMAKPGVLLRRPVGSNDPSAKMPSYPGSIRSRKRTRGLKPRNQNPSLTASTTKLAKKRHSRSRESRSGARANVEGKRSHERKEGNGASRQSQKRQKRLKKLAELTRLRSKRSTEIVPPLTSGHIPRMRAGEGRRRNWRQHYAGRAINSKVTLHYPRRGPRPALNSMRRIFAALLFIC